MNFNANHWRNNPQKEEVFISVIKQEKNQETGLAVLYLPNLNYGMENDAIIERKIEKVFEPITIGFFTTMRALGFGFLIGSILGVFTEILG
ncbi:hypothetical protein [Candidatus Bartonella washoeensis]|uniref:Uncharacterized protein n=1 Tax=Cardidatus Bartonella washoeensis 085-0475 TaxID=1094564 RepID=J0QJM4_9HYPH|nr:hypothetical protein MCW_00753 [Bartonella washoeensis 085-0475]